MTEHENQTRRKRKITIYRVGSVIGGLMLVVLGAFLTAQIIKSLPVQQIDASKYQVVYLTNGQAYFGKLQNTNGDFLFLKSPYIAQSVANNEKSDTSNTGAAQTTILKVTDQVYGPEDSIAIKSSQVTFWQNLRDDSKVSQAIKAKE